MEETLDTFCASTILSGSANHNTRLLIAAKQAMVCATCTIPPIVTRVGTYWSLNGDFVQKELYALSKTV